MAAHASNVFFSVRFALDPVLRLRYWPLGMYMDYLTFAVHVMGCPDFAGNLALQLVHIASCTSCGVPSVEIQPRY